MEIIKNIERRLYGNNLVHKKVCDVCFYSALKMTKGQTLGEALLNKKFYTALDNRRRAMLNKHFVQRRECRVCGNRHRLCKPCFDNLREKPAQKMSSHRCITWQRFNWVAGQEVPVNRRQPV